MKQLEQLLEMWKSDCDIDRTEPGKALLDIPKLHSKYLNILSKHRLMAKEVDFKYRKMKKLKYEYYSGKLDQAELDKYGWEPFQYILKSDMATYYDSDDDLIKLTAQKQLHDEIVELCTTIMRELNSRTYQLRDYISWEKFIQGV